jgi:transcription elongation factor GreA
MTEKLPITKDGYSRLEEEYSHLKKVERPAVINQIAEAREHGDLKENAEYHAAREKQSFLEGRIAELEDKIARAEVIDVSSLSGSTVRFGATVSLIDADTEKQIKYQIVGEYEANLENGKISIKSPIARAIIGKDEEDEVEVQTPGGVRTYEIEKVEYK